MLGLDKRFAVASVLVIATAAALDGARPSPAARRAVAATRASATTLPAGTWRRLPTAPVAPNAGLTSVWTGSRMLLFGRLETHAKDGAVLERVNVAAAYDPGANSWRRLSPPGPTGSFLGYSSVWTDKEMLVWGQGTREAFNPSTNRWRQLPGTRLLAVHDGFGLVVWTGRELIGWGGGCCGDAFSDGVAYSPASNSWRALAGSPLAGSQHPVGAWTGRELVVLVGDRDPSGKPWPARLARAAAYDPGTGTWRRIARPPVAGGTAVWDGREVLVVGGGTNGRSAIAYDPTTNRWRRLARLPSRRSEATMVWTRKRLLLWGGSETAGGGAPVIPPHGLAYDPQADRWSALPRAPLVGRLGPTAVWTGRVMIVWGGSRPKKPLGTGTEFANDGAAFTPARP
jgi:N-acetylneuraminic acid mutarotase